MTSIKLEEFHKYLIMLKAGKIGTPNKPKPQVKR